MERQALAQVNRNERRNRIEAALGALQAGLPEGRYGVIYADPPWRFGFWSRSTSNSRADHHYPTLDTKEIITRFDVPSIAASDSALFLWATVPMLLGALDVMAAWGFAYRSNFDWAKDRIGTGYWNRNQHEHLLVGTRGDIPAPAPGTQRASLIFAPMREHSRKPDEVYGLIESYFPTLPKIELFARGQARPGWSCWGNEAVMGDSAQAAE